MKTYNKLFEEDVQIFTYNEKISAIIQEYLFENGYTWTSGEKLIKHTDCEYLINRNNSFFYFRRWKSSDKKLINPSDLDLKFDWCIDLSKLNSNQLETLKDYAGFNCSFIGKYFGKRRYLPICFSSPFGVELTFEEFKVLFIKQEKETKMETQTITRNQLISLYHSDDCNEWKEYIKDILIKNILEEDVLEENIVIKQEWIEKLLNQGSEKQKNLVKSLGVVLIFDDSVELDYGTYLKSKLGTMLIDVRKSNNPKYSFKSFWLNPKFNWKIEVDDENYLVLIPTQKQ